MAGILPAPPPAGVARNAGRPPAHWIVLVAIFSATPFLLKTGGESRSELAACTLVVECRAGKLQPLRSTRVADQRIEHAMGLSDDAGAVERMLGIACRLDDTLAQNFAAGFDLNLRRPMLRI